MVIPTPEDIKKRVGVWQKEHDNFGVRWIRPDNLHITVVPPWYATENELYEAAWVLQAASTKVRPCVANFTKVLFGPPGRTPRLIWAEGKTPPELRQLKDTVQNALFDNETTGFSKKENRPALLHLTIARFRPHEIKNKPQLNGAIDWKFDVGEIRLMESVLKRTGAEYTVLQKFQLE